MACGRVLFQRVRVDDVGHTIIHADFGITMESDGFKQFCSALTAWSNPL